MNLKKLKESARKHEQKEDWPTAIKIYLRAIEASESGLESVPDLSLYNRVGDLYMKLNDTAQAVKTFERAVDLYADQGFANNAIAICGKILRVNPGRMHTYLTLAKLYARKNFVVDAKKNLLEYLDRMNKANRRDEAFREVSGFAEQFQGEAEIRDMLRDLVQAASREAHSTDHLDKLAAQLEAGPPGAAGDVSETASRGSMRRRPGDLVFLDTGTDQLADPTLEPLEELPELPEPPPPPPPPPDVPETKGPTADLPLLDLGEEPMPEVLEPDVVVAADDIDARGADLDEAESEAASTEEVPELEGIEPTVLEQGESAEVNAIDGLEVGGGITIEDQAEGSAQELEAEVEPTAIEGVELESVPTPLEDLEVGEFETLQPDEIDGALVDEAAAEPEEEAPTLGEEEPVELEPSVEDERLSPSVGSWDGEATEEDEAVDLVEEDAWSEGAFPAEEDVAPPAWQQEVAGGEAAWTADGVSEVRDEEPEEPIEVSFPEYEAEEESPEFAVATPGGSAGTQASHVVDTMEEDVTEIAELEWRVAQTPNDPFAHRALGEALIAARSKERGLYELELALAGFEARQDWGRSTDVLRELVRLDPNRIWYYQKRVELAYRSGEKGRLVEAYLELGDVLVRVGSLEKALAVYGRVLEHDPANEFARAALDVLQPAAPSDEPERVAAPHHVPGARAEPAEATEDEEYVDFGALVLGPRPQRDTRIRIGDEVPTGDEARDFEVMLEQFKAALEESLTDEDYQAHYDLGVAFKEMGLLDEAIAEFQKALRAPEGRLRTSEALGVSFYEKGQYAVAEAILRRAVEGISGLDDEKIGLLYWLGRSTESLGRSRDALTAYERAMAVDVGFMDIGERVRRIETGLA